jgi:hypothetical protein
MSAANLPCSCSAWVVASQQLCQQCSSMDALLLLLLLHEAVEGCCSHM